MRSLVTNSDNDVAGITVAATTPRRRPKPAGRRVHHRVVFTADGERDDRAQLGNTNEARSSASFVFTTGNWNVTQTVTVTGVNDDVVDSDPRS
jgi:hypothetical protein